MYQHPFMDCRYSFSTEKNNKLIEERGISFEEVIAVIEANSVIDIMEHPNQTRYPNQKIYVIEVNDYVYLLPFVRENEESVFLKTIIPN